MPTNLGPCCCGEGGGGDCTCPVCNDAVGQASATYDFSDSNCEDYSGTYFADCVSGDELNQTCGWFGTLDLGGGDEISIAVEIYPEAGNPGFFEVVANLEIAVAGQLATTLFFSAQGIANPCGTRALGFDGQLGGDQCSFGTTPTCSVTVPNA